MPETFQEYTARLLSLAEGRDPFEVLATTADRIEQMIDGRRREDLSRAPAPGAWSVAEIVSHLADSEIVFAYRVRMILSTPGTPIQAYNQDNWSKAVRAAESDPRDSLALFRAVRTSMLRLLRGLGDEELDRFGLHAERGKESVRHLIRLYAGHDRNHLAQIERLV
jgi:hypothetical protein